MLINCPKCNQTLRLPSSLIESSQIICPACNQIFNNPIRVIVQSPERRIPQKPVKKGSKIDSYIVLTAIVFLVIAVFLALLYLSSPGDDIKQPVVGRKHSNWETIQYGAKVNYDIITHSGETIGEILKTFQSGNPSHKGLLQPYLEPFSMICNDYLTSSNHEMEDRFINILYHYPVGSEQPAWAALFHEGHFQLYYNDSLIRIFIKGNDPETSFKKHLSVIRHPLRDLFNSNGTAIKKLEVYVFNNDYKNTEIWLNTIPQVYLPGEIDLSAHREPLCLESMEAFLNYGALLMAAEIDQENKFYLHGKGTTNLTIANKQVSLADIAVAYRAVFHHGYNEPYISLDQHEDNRYAKVNFGGNLQNTHIGHVVLEADKLFKTLSTGLDPNTRDNVKNKFAHAVPGFLTEDERSLLSGRSRPGSQQIRYWFYPEGIMTVTNGSIGAILKDQFLADTERMDSDISINRASKETINHLNKNYSYYLKADNTFNELSNVGRLMAIMNWLKELGMENRVELDDLLSVKIPAFSTPKKTRKILAVTALAPASAALTSNYVRENSKTMDFSFLLEKISPAISDDHILKMALDYFSEMKKSDIYPPRYRYLEKQIDRYKYLIESTSEKIELNSRNIENAERNLNRQSSREVDIFNVMVAAYNKLLVDYENYINYYNSLINELNGMNLTVSSLASVGGGISLRSEEFGKVTMDINSPLIQNIMGVKNYYIRSDNLYHAGEWVRSGNHSSGARINELNIGVSNN